MISASSRKPLPIEAQRYAEALYELASEQHALPTVESDLLKLKEMLATSRELRQFLFSPLLRRTLTARGLDAVLSDAQAAKLTQSFFHIVAANGRGRDIPTILEAFFAKVAEQRGELYAEVVSAHPLSAEQTEALRAALLKAFSAQGARDVKIHARVEPGLLGGLRVQVGSFLFDGSLKGGLQKLGSSLRTAA